MRKLGLAIIFLLCVVMLTPLLMANAKADVTTTIYASKDSYINSAQPNINWGIYVELHVGTLLTPFPGGYRVFIYFDLSSIPLGSSISSAILKLYYFFQNYGCAGRIHWAYRLTRSWVEGTGWGQSVPGVTWNTYDGTNSWSTPGGDYVTLKGASATVPSSYGWMSWAVTDIVQDWVSGTYANYGFLIKDQDEGIGPSRAYFYSREAASWAQVLEVTYTPPVGGVPEFALTFPVVTSIAVAAYLTIKRRISKKPE